MKSGDWSFRPPLSALVLCAGLATLGGAALAAGLHRSPERAWLNLLLVSYFLLSLGLGGLVFIATQYVSGAGWSVSLRRVPEAMAAVVPVAALGLGAVFLARPSLYPWAGAAAGEGGAVNPLRQAWFNPPFFLARAAFYLACWIGLGLALVRTSRRQDRDGDPAHSRTNVRLSALFLVVFAVTFWLATQDWLMALDAGWSSTIFAVYQFGGLFLGGLAGITLLAGRWLDVYLQVVPPSGGTPTAGIAWEIGLAAGAAGLFALVFFAALGRAAIIPVRDPFLSESLQELDREPVHRFASR